MSYRIARLPAGRELLAGAIVMKAAVNGELRGKKMTETSFVVYQLSGETLSGIYVYGGSLSRRKARAYATAAQSARNLRRHS